MRQDLIRDGCYSGEPVERVVGVDHLDSHSIESVVVSIQGMDALHALDGR
jgi:hypothetical protein